MKIFKSLSKPIVALAILLLSATLAEAGYGYKIGATSVDDVTLTACTTSDTQNVDMFGNGADMDQVWALEKEVGSPGSGAWEKISGFKDVFPTASSATTQIARYVADKASCFRLHMTTDGGGTGQVGIVTNRNTGTAVGDEINFTSVVKFDDFHGSVLGVAALGTNSSDWITFGGDGAGNQVVGIEEVSPEGILTFTSGSDDDADDAVEVTYGSNSFSALISDGVTIIECRSAIDAITASQFACGLTEDFAANGAEDMEHIISGGTITDQGAVSSGVSIMFSTDATTDVWQAVSTNATNIGNAAAEYTLGATPVAGTYDRLRIEVDALGHAYFYVNDSLQGVEPLAVATAALMQPWLGTMSTTTTIVKTDTDYVLFVAPRPSGT